MQLQQRIDLLFRLGEYMQSEKEEWKEAKQNAAVENGWFLPEFIELSVKNIALHFLQIDKLRAWAAQYHLPEANPLPKNIGLVMAGNIPLVGFHDFLGIFISTKYNIL